MSSWETHREVQYNDRRKNSLLAPMRSNHASQQIRARESFVAPFRDGGQGGEPGRQAGRQHKDVLAGDAAMDGGD